MKSGFDRLATPYRWVEYLTFGRALERCRYHFLAEMTGTRYALLLGDGDGRFAAQLLLAAPFAQAHAIDGSRSMLTALQNRCTAVGRGSHLTVHHADLTDGLRLSRNLSFDLVATHFVLDCMPERDIDLLVSQVKPLLAEEGRWVVSEFNIPQGAMHVPARLLVWTLYVAFRLLAGLRVRKLPDYATVFSRHDFKRVRRVPSLCGLLVSEVWVQTGS